MSLETARTHLWRYVMGGGTSVSPAGTSVMTSLDKQADLARTTKTLQLKTEKGGVRVICAGDAIIDLEKFSDHFSFGTAVLEPGEADSRAGESDDQDSASRVPVYLDESMLRFDTVLQPIAGDGTVELTLEELFKRAKAKGWVDICRTPDTASGK